MHGAKLGLIFHGQEQLYPPPPYALSPLAEYHEQLCSLCDAPVTVTAVTHQYASQARDKERIYIKTRKFRLSYACHLKTLSNYDVAMALTFIKPTVSFQFSLFHDMR